MTNYSLALNTVAHSSFNVSKMSGHEKVLLTSAVFIKGDLAKTLATDDIKSAWSKTVLKSSYRSTALQRAKDRNWLSTVSKGLHRVTQEGLDHLDSIAKLSTSSGTIAPTGGLKLFLAGETHSFDKYLRQIFANAKTMVRIADSYVDETIFDNLLDQIPKTARIRLIYGKSYKTFDQRVVRFSAEYTRFALKKNTKLHDRFAIVDSVAYILGPSLKDAAKDSPASIVKLNSQDSLALIHFFDEIWKNSQPHV